MTLDPYRFQAWRTLIAGLKDDTSRLYAFKEASADIAGQVKQGRFDKSDGIDELIAQAEVYGLTAALGQGEVERIIGEQFKTTEDDGKKKGKANGKDHEPMLLASPYVAPNPSQIPKRAWLHGGHYIREVATATVAPGGFGKTTLTLYEALLMAQNGLRVWYISGEDPKVEIDRRIAAHCQHHSISLNLLSGKLFVDDRATFPFFIARSPRAAAVAFDERVLTQFETAILTDAIDVVMLDPFVSFHSVPENDNGAIDAVCKRLGGISYRTHCCIEISHHVRKSAPGQVTITVDDTRGGGAIVNAVRSSRVINRMSSAEAESAKIMPDQRASYIRLDRGKRNMAPADAANWYHIVSVELPNGDNVQSLEPWEFPKEREITKDDDEWVKVKVKQNKYRTSSQAEDWLGIAVAEYFKLDLKQKNDCKLVAKIIKQWLQSGILAKAEDKDEATRKKREFFVVAQEQKISVVDLNNSAPLPFEDDYV